MWFYPALHDNRGRRIFFSDALLIKLIFGRPVGHPSRILCTPGNECVTYCVLPFQGNAGLMDGHCRSRSEWMKVRCFTHSSFCPGRKMRFQRFQESGMSTICHVSTACATFLRYTIVRIAIFTCVRVVRFKQRPCECVSMLFPPLKVPATPTRPFIELVHS
jgi:hypothetical protein